jgi:uncharacterized membrane protein
MGTSGMKGSQMSIPRQTAKGHPHCALMAAAFAFAALSIPPLDDRAAFGQCSYEVTAIVTGPDCPFFGQAALIPTALNERGDIAGYWLECDVSANQAFFRSAETGVLTTLPRPPGVWSAVATGLNDNGLIIGTHSISGVGDRGFVYDLNNPGAGFTYMEPKHGVGGSWANALNNAGVVAGARSISKSGINPYNAVMWRPLEKGAPIEDLGTMQGPHSTSLALNSSADATGWTGTLTMMEGWLLMERQLLLLGFGENGVMSAGNDVNERVAVAGGIAHNNGGPIASTPAIWMDWQWALLKTLSICNSSTALAMNDIMQVGGLCVLASNQQRGFLWQNGNVHDLNDLVDVPAIVGRVIDMNNAGQILARLGNTNGILLTPQDVPFGDLNYDCKIDVHDLLIVFEQWGAVSRSQSAPGVPSADLNGDGVVDVTDLLILFDHWNP